MFKNDSITSMLIITACVLPLRNILACHDLQIGASALLIAAQGGHATVVEYLCAHGADASLALYDDATPLMLAAQNGHRRVLETLHRHGADLSAKRAVGSSFALSAISSVSVALSRQFSNFQTSSLLFL